MELAAAAVGALVTVTGQHLCGCVCSGMNLQSNHGALKKEMKSLMDRREEVEDETRKADDQGHGIRADVKKWLVDVEELLRKNNPILGPPQCSLNCCNWCGANREVMKLINKITGLLNDGSFPNGVADPSPRAVLHFPVPSIRSQETASEILDKTKSLLDDNRFRSIGIWGPGGVGKTVLVKNLNNELGTTSTQPFNIVIWATVPKDLDMKKIQLDIAKRLNLDVQADDVQGAAIKLNGRLMKVEKFLLILDDVWKKIDLYTLGVPGPQVHNGCKIIFTSQELRVCREMECDDEVEMKGLSDEDTLQLFCEKANVLNDEEIRPLAEAIARECQRLPVEIIAMGAAMRNMTKVQREETLRDLTSQVPSYGSKPLKLSYDSLQDDNTRSCFLYCSLFPKAFSIKISELEKYLLAEGLIDEQHSINRLIDNLKDSCLLEDGADEGTVKMHEVVRDFAIQIASSSEDRFKSLVRSGIGLSEISIEDFLNLDSLKRISFMSNEITSLPDCEIQCSEASTLLLQCNRPLKKVPERFLQGFVALRVLNLSETNIQSLPVSIMQLGDLRALLLRNCWYLGELPLLEKLSRLEMLDLSGTNIRKLPQEMENLSNLRQLYLSHIDYLETIPAGIISRLSRLEVLDMTDSAYELLVEPEENKGEMTFEEFRYLDQLLFSSIRLKMIPSLNSEDLSWINRLKGFQISIGPTIGLTTTNEKRVIVGHVDFAQVDFAQVSIKELWDIAESLVLNDCGGLYEMLEDLVNNSGRCFTGLKSLAITGVQSFDRRVQVIGGLAAQRDLLPNLEELTLEKVDVLESISELVGYLGLRFHKLKLIKVSDCSDMKYLLSCGNFIQTLPELQMIKVSSCKNLVELFNYDSRSNMVPNLVVPKLRILKLKKLPKLTTLCRHEETWLRLEQVEVLRCGRLRRLPLSKQNAGTVKEIKGKSEWWDALVWDDDKTKSSLVSSFRPARDLVAST